MTPFNPIGERARWRIVYDHALRGKDHDAVVTYAELGAVLNLDPDEDRHAIQMAVRRAAQEFEEVDKRALTPVPNVGYRVVNAPEHMQLAQRQQRRSHRALRAGRSKVVNVDIAALEPEARKAFELVARAFAAQMDFNRRMDVRHKRLEDVTRLVTERQERSDAEIARLQARLDRLEAADHPTPDES